MIHPTLFSRDYENINHYPYDPWGWYIYLHLPFTIQINEKMWGEFTSPMDPSWVMEIWWSWESMELMRPHFWCASCPETMYETLGITGDKLITHVFGGFCHGPFVSSINAIVRRWEAQFPYASKRPENRQWRCGLWKPFKIQLTQKNEFRLHDIGSWRKGAR